MTAEEFKQIRTDLKMTQSELANALGFKSALSISHMETGFRDVSLITEKSILLLKKTFKPKQKKC